MARRRRIAAVAVAPIRDEKPIGSGAGSRKNLRRIRTLSRQGGVNGLPHPLPLRLPHPRQCAPLVLRHFADPKKLKSQLGLARVSTAHSVSIALTVAAGRGCPHRSARLRFGLSPANRRRSFQPQNSSPAGDDRAFSCAGVISSAGAAGHQRFASAVNALAIVCVTVLAPAPDSRLTSPRRTNCASAPDLLASNPIPRDALGAKIGDRRRGGLPASGEDAAARGARRCYDQSPKNPRKPFFFLRR